MRRNGGVANADTERNADVNAGASTNTEAGSLNGKSKEVDGMKNIAQFAVALCEAFRTRLGEDSSKTFCQLLKQTLLSEYRAWWLSVRPAPSLCPIYVLMLLNLSDRH